MRSFRQNRDNLRDTRIAYTFLLSLALVCAILGITASRLGGDLKESRLQNCYESLTLCADALDAWQTAENAEARYEASVRFESAAASLPGDVDLDAVIPLVNYMRMGQSSAETVRAFSDTFALLSSIEYTDAGEAHCIISETLNAVGAAFDWTSTGPADTVSYLPEVVAYSERVAKKTAKELLGVASVNINVRLNEDVGVLIGQTQNLRMSFSPSDGSLDGFVYIRIGEGPDVVTTPEERLFAALEFYKSTRRGVGGAKAEITGEICGFTVCDITDGDEVWRIAVDSGARVWTLTKVKR